MQQDMYNKHIIIGILYVGIQEMKGRKIRQLHVPEK